MGRPPLRSAREDYASAFGKALDQQLTRRGLRQSDVANRTGVSQSHLSRLMHNAKVSPEWADLVADTIAATEMERYELHTAAARSWGYKLDVTKPK